MSDSKNEIRSVIEKPNQNISAYDVFEEFTPIQPIINQMASPLKEDEQDPTQGFLDFSPEYELTIAKDMAAQRKLGKDNKPSFGDYEDIQSKLDKMQPAQPKQVRSNFFLNLLTLLTGLAKFSELSNTRPSTMFVSAETTPPLPTQSGSWVVESEVAVSSSSFLLPETPGTGEGLSPIILPSVSGDYPVFDPSADAGAHLIDKIIGKNFLETYRKNHSKSKTDSFSFMPSQKRVTEGLVLVMIGALCYTIYHTSLGQGILTICTRDSKKSKASPDKEEKKIKPPSDQKDSPNDEIDLDLYAKIVGISVTTCLVLSVLPDPPYSKNKILLIAAITTLLMAWSVEKKPPNKTPPSKPVIQLDAEEIKQKAIKLEEYLTDQQLDINSKDYKHLGLDQNIANLNQDIDEAKTFIAQQLKLCFEDSDAKKRDKLAQAPLLANLNDRLSDLDSKDGIKEKFARLENEKKLRSQETLRLQKQLKLQKQEVKQSFKKLHTQLETQHTIFQKLNHENPEHDFSKKLLFDLEGLLKMHTEMQEKPQELSNENISDFSRELDEHVQKTQKKIEGLQSRHKAIADEIAASKAITELKENYQSKLKQIFPSLSAHEHITADDFPTREIIQHLSSHKTLLSLPTTEAIEKANKTKSALIDLQDDLKAIEKSIGTLTKSSTLSEINELKDKVAKLDVFAIKASMASANTIATSNFPESKPPATRDVISTFLSRSERTLARLAQQSGREAKQPKKDKKKIKRTPQKAEFVPQGPTSTTSISSTSSSSPPKEKPEAKRTKPKTALAKTDKLQNVLEAAVEVILGMERILSSKNNSYCKDYPQLCRQAMLGAMMFISKDLFNVLHQNRIGNQCMYMHVNINHYSGLLDGISSPEQVAVAFKLFYAQLKHFKNNPDPKNSEVFTETLKDNPIFAKLLLPQEYKMQQKKYHFPSKEELSFLDLRNKFTRTLSGMDERSVTPEMRVINQLANDYIQAKANDQYDRHAVDMEEVDFNLEHPEVSLPGERKRGNQLRHPESSKKNTSYIEGLHQNYLDVGDPEFVPKGTLLLKRNVTSIAYLTNVRSFSHSPLSSSASSSRSSSTSSSVSSTSNSFAIPVPPGS